MNFKKTSKINKLVITPIKYISSIKTIVFLFSLIIFSSEMLIMYFIRGYSSSISENYKSLIDSISLIIIVVPTLYFIVFYPLQKQLKNRNEILNKLKISELNFSKSILTIPDAVAITELENGKFLEVNDVMADLLEYSKEELIGRNTLDLFIWSNPNQRLKFVNKLKATGAISNYLTVFKSKNNRKINALISCSIITKDDVSCILLIGRDVTFYRNELKKVLTDKENIKKENALFQGLFNNTTIGLYQTTPEGEILSANPAILKMLKFETFEELTTRNLTQGSYADTSKREKFKNLLEKYGELTDFESQWYTKDRDIITVREGARAVKDENGHIFRYDGFVQDISELKRGEEELVKMNQAINNSKDIIFYTNKNQIITYINKEFTKIYGYTANEIIGNKTPRILSGNIHSSEYEETCWNAAVQNERETVEFINKNKSGKLINIEASASKIWDEFGNHSGYIVIQRDITDRKRKETIQNIIFNISNAAQIESDFTRFLKLIQKELGRIVDTKNFFVALYNKDDDSINLPYYRDEKDHIVDFPAKNTLTNEVIKRGEILLFNEAEIYKFKNENFINSVGKTPKIWLGVPLKIKGVVTGAIVIQSYENENAYSEEDKKVLEIISYQINISIELRRSQEELLKALEKAKESERLKSSLLANLSHEIRTPMNGILGFSGLLKNSNITLDKQKLYLDIIEKSSKRLLNTINDIIDISKLEAGQEKVTLSEFDVNKQLNELFDFFIPEINKEKLQLKISKKLVDNESIIKTDENKIYGILLNLIKNAIKFTNQGSIEFGCVKKQTQLEYFVKDTGVGIPIDLQNSIFDSFFQVENSDKFVREGSGLGLAISKSYTDLLGGTITVSSDIGKGTIFYVNIPFESSDKVDQLESNKHQLIDKTTDKSTILIAEDEEFNYIYLESLIIDLLKIDCNLIHAKNGLEAVEFIKSNSMISLVLMDLNMPVMNGFEATKKIKEINSEIPIIVQSAYSTATDKEKAFEAGCNDFIAKPIKTEEFEQLLNKYIILNV